MAFESSIPSATIEELLTKVKDVEDNKGGLVGQNNITNVFATISPAVLTGSTEYGNTTILRTSVNITLSNNSGKTINSIKCTAMVMLNNALSEGGTWYYDTPIESGQEKSFTYESGQSLVVENTNDRVLVGKLFFKLGICYSEFTAVGYVMTNMVDLIIGPSSQGSSGQVGTLKDQGVVLSESDYSEIESSAALDGVLYFVTPD